MGSQSWCLVRIFDFKIFFWIEFDRTCLSVFLFSVSGLTPYLTWHKHTWYLFCTDKTNLRFNAKRYKYILVDKLHICWWTWLYILMSTSLRQQSCLWKLWTEGQIYENSWTVFDVGSNICHAQWHVQGGAGNISNLIQTQMNLDEFVHFCWPSHLKEDCTNIFKGATISCRKNLFSSCFN